MNASPTHRTYDSLNQAYAFFNRRLFAGTLPPCLITMQRHKGAYGYFSGDRFASASDPGEITDEIALNPAHFAARGPAAVLSTLAHEMAHLWQHHFGKPSRSSYHNAEWAAKMQAIGLVPSDTGKPGGKATGQKVSHFVQPGGAFEAACNEFLAKNPAILYQDRAGDEENRTARKRKAASKTKFTCEECGLNAWAKPDAALICGDCEKVMQPEEAETPKRGYQGNETSAPRYQP